MPRLITILLALCVSFTSVRADSPQLGYTAWYYKEAKVFKRIAEYFGGGERTARKVILRTDPESRAGLYFVCRLDGGDVKDYPEGSKFVLELVTPDSPREKIFDFPIPDTAPDEKEIWLGLTGKDVPTDDAPPVAWRIKVLAPDGSLLATRQSYLWSHEEPAS